MDIIISETLNINEENHAEPFPFNTLPAYAFSFGFWAVISNLIMQFPQIYKPLSPHIYYFLSFSLPLLHAYFYV